MAPRHPKARGNRHTKQNHNRQGPQSQERSDQKNTAHPTKQGPPHHQPNQPTTTPQPPQTEATGHGSRPNMASTTWHAVEFSRTGRAPPKALSDPSGGNRSNLPEPPHQSQPPDQSHPNPGRTHHPDTHTNRHRARHTSQGATPGPATLRRAVSVPPSRAARRYVTHPPRAGQPGVP